MIRRARAGSVFARRRQSLSCRAIRDLFCIAVRGESSVSWNTRSASAGCSYCQRFRDPGVIGPALSGAADVPDERQHPIGLDPRRGRQESIVKLLHLWEHRERFQTLHGRAGGPVPRRRDSAKLGRVVPVRTRRDSGSRAANRGIVGFDRGELEQLALQRSLLVR